MPLREESDVQAKLRTLAETDPYQSPDDGKKEGPERFVVRFFAARSLQPPASLLYYVTRTPDTRTCQVQRASGQTADELLIGPYDSGIARENMCRHYDSTGHDPSFCWLVQPRNACPKDP